MFIVDDTLWRKNAAEIWKYSVVRYLKNGEYLSLLIIRRQNIDTRATLMVE